MKKEKILFAVIGGILALSVSAPMMREAKADDLLKAIPDNVICSWNDKDTNSHVVENGVQFLHKGRNTPNYNTWEHNPTIFYKHFTKENSIVPSLMRISEGKGVGVDFSIGIRDSEDYSIVNPCGNGNGFFVHAVGVDDKYNETDILTLKLILCDTPETPDGETKQHTEYAILDLAKGWDDLLPDGSKKWWIYNDLNPSTLNRGSFKDSFRIGFDLEHGFMSQFFVWDTTYWRPLESTESKDYTMGTYIKNKLGDKYDHIKYISFRIEPDNGWVDDQIIQVNGLYSNIEMVSDGHRDYAPSAPYTPVGPFELGTIENAYQDEPYTVPVSSIYNTTYKISVDNGDYVDGTTFVSDTLGDHEVSIKATVQGNTASDSKVFTKTTTVTVVESSKHLVVVDGVRQRVADGEKATLIPNPPEHYHFVKWVDGDEQDFDPNAPITTDMVINGVYEIDKFLVKFGADDEGTTYDYGEEIIKPAVDPVKDPTPEHTYTFVGWFDGDTKFVEGTTATKDVTYEAKFEEDGRQYLVKFGEDDDGVLYEYGDEIIPPAEVPTKDPDEAYTYRFVGWYDGETKFVDGTTCTKEVTYEAKFAVNERLPLDLENLDFSHIAKNPCEGSETIRTLEGVEVTAKGVDERGDLGWTEEIKLPNRNLADGDQLEDNLKAQFNIENGQSAGFTFSINMRDPDTMQIIHGSDWDPWCFMISVCDASTDETLSILRLNTGEAKDVSPQVCAYDSYDMHDTVYWLLGKATLKSSFTVKFDKENLWSGLVQPGDDPVRYERLDSNDDYLRNAISDRVASVKDVYFKITGNHGWASKQTVIIRELNGVALAKESVNLTVDGVTSKIEKGSVPTIETPTKEGYTFAGWVDATTKEPVDMTQPVNEDLSIVSTWTANEYVVKFGASDEGTTYKFGETIVAPADPVKPADAQYTYTFDGWYDGETKFVEGTTATKDVTYEARFTSTVRKYKISFDGVEAMMPYGATIVAPADPVKPADAQYTYTFDGWYSGETKFVTGMTVVGDMAFVAKWKQTVNKYTVSFDGVSQQLEYGATIVPPADPVKEGYTFEGWYNGDTKFVAGTKVTGNVEFTSKWKENEKKGGCGGSIIAGSIAITLAAACGAVLLAKKKHEDK